MPKTYKILLASGEAGGAECLCPLAKRLIASGHDVHVVCGPISAGIFARENLPTTPVPGRFPEANDVIAVLNVIQPDLVVTGILGRKWNLDYLMMDHAKAQNLPIVSILDSWLLYAQRFFEGEHARERYFPTKLAVMDETCVNELDAIGVPKEICEVTGHPKFDALFDLRKKRENSDFRKSLQKKYSVPADHKTLLFFSQPLSFHHKKEVLGYNEFEVFDIVFAALRVIQKKFKVSLILKEHPELNSFRHNREKLPPHVQVIDSADADELLILSDVVLGMSTTILVYAYLLDVPSVSIQPNVLIDHNMLTRTKIQSVIQNENELVLALEKILTNVASQKNKPLFNLDGRVCERLENLLIQVIERKSHGA